MTTTLCEFVEKNGVLVCPVCKTRRPLGQSVLRICGPEREGQYEAVSPRTRAQAEAAPRLTEPRRAEPPAKPAKALCDFIEVGDEIVCRNCETRRPIAKKGLVRYCTGQTVPPQAAPPRRRDPRLAALAPRETDLAKLAELLKPCKCPTAKIEQRGAAGKMLAEWPAPAVLDNGSWAVGVTTAPRDESSIAITLRCLNVNGWRPTVFAEPDSPDLGPNQYVLEQNVIRRGAWHNWKNAVMRLLATGAEHILIAQDDTWIVPGTRLFLDRMRWPKDAAFVSLYLAGHQMPKAKQGLVRVDVSRGVYWGACGWCFKRETLLRLLMCDVSRGWRGVGKDRTSRLDDEVRNIDTCITRTLRQLKLRPYAIAPSASQHVAPASSIWGTKEKPRSDTGKRSAGVVVGDWSALDGKLEPSGDEAYDLAAAAWARLVGRPDYPIAPGLWQELRGMLSPGVRVLEFGSGLSSRLMRSTGASVTSVEQNAVIAAYSGATYSRVKRGWYTWKPEGQYDVVLIDGPARRGREGVLPHLDSLLAPGGVVIIDDAHREPEAALAGEVGRLVSGSVEVRGEARRWAVVRDGRGQQQAEAA